MKRSRSVVMALVVLLGAVACSTPPRLDVERANTARAIRSPKTPREERKLMAECRGEVRKLSSWAERAGPGDVIDVRLEPGVYEIDEPIVIKGASVVMHGPGPDAARLELESEDWRALSFVNCPSVEIRGVSIVGGSGGGVDARNCPRVVVNECDFAAARYGLELSSSSAVIDSCVFASNERGVKMEGASVLTVRSTAFVEGWWSIEGTGRVDAFGCVFASNEHGVALKGPSAFRSCLFGPLEGLNAPGTLLASSLVFDDLLEIHQRQKDTMPNRLLRSLDEFPDSLYEDVPPGLNLGAIHYALERGRTRGKSDVEKLAVAVLEVEATRYLEAARKAVAARAMGPAHELARRGLDYVHACGRNRNADLLRALETIGQS